MIYKGKQARLKRRVKLLQTRSEVRQQLRELSRRGQWLRCLDVVQQLVKTRSAGATQAVLQQPSLLRRVVQQTWPDASPRSLKQTWAVLVLCGQALDAAPHPLYTSAEMPDGTDPAENLTRGRNRNSPGSASNSTSVYGECAPTSKEPLTSVRNEAALSASQMRQWTLLVTFLLQDFLAGMSVSSYDKEETKPSSSSPDLQPVAAVVALEPSEMSALSVAVVKVCAWAARVQLRVNASLLFKSRVTAMSLQRAAQHQPNKRGSTESLRLSRRKTKRIPIKSVASEPSECQPRQDASKNHSKPLTHVQRSQDLSRRSATLSRITPHLAAAWKRATDSVGKSADSPTKASRTAQTNHFFGLDADIRAGFRQALGRIRSKEDVRASADYVLSLYPFITQFTRRCTVGETAAPSTSCLTPEKQVSHFCAFCEEVLDAVERIAASASLNDVQSLAEFRRAALEGMVVVAAAELMVLQLACSEESPINVVKPRRVTHTSRLPSFTTSECQLHATRAVCFLCISVTKLIATDATDTGLSMMAVASPALQTGNITWFVSALKEVQGSCAQEMTEKADTELFLLHLLVNTAWLTQYAGGVDDDMRAHVSATAAQLIMAAVSRDQAKATVADKVAATSDFVRELRRALRLPLRDDWKKNATTHTFDHIGLRGEMKNDLQPSLFQSSLSPSRTELVAAEPLVARFVCDVLNSCPAWLSYALLTGSLEHKGVGTQRTPSDDLTPVEQESLLLALLALSSCFSVYQAKHTAPQESLGDQGKYASLSNHAASAHCFASAENASPVSSTSPGPIPFLTYVLASLSTKSLVKLTQKFLSTDTKPVLHAAARPVHGSQNHAGGLKGRFTKALVLRCVLISIPDLCIRSNVAQEILNGFSKSLTLKCECVALAGARVSSSAYTTRTQVEEEVEIMGVLMESLLLNLVVSAPTTGACMQRWLKTLAQVVAAQRRLGTREANEVQFTVLNSVRQWFASNTLGYLNHRVSLLLATPLPKSSSSPSLSVKGANKQSSLTQDAAKNTVSVSAAQRRALCFEGQFSHLSSHPWQPSSTNQRMSVLRRSVSSEEVPHQRMQDREEELTNLCRFTATHMRRLCTTVTFQSIKNGLIPVATQASGRNAPSSGVRSRLNDEQMMQTLCAAVCHCVYDHVGVAQLCHLAIASAPTAFEFYSQRTPESRVALNTASKQHSAPSVCALINTSPSLGSPLLHNKAALTSFGPLFTLRSAASSASEDGLLNVLQLHHGTPLSATQHTQLVQAMHDLSRRRRVREAVALFYSYERKHRRLTLPEVELFADIAKRATTPFLVRLVCYVPPPCESPVLATAIVVGAWKSYQRALRHYVELCGKAPMDQQQQRQPRSVASVTTQQQHEGRRTTVERAWYEAVAIALQAMELLPASPPLLIALQKEETLSQKQRLHTLIATLYRLVHAQPSWLLNVNAANTHNADVAWDVVQARATILTSQFLGFPSLRYRLRQEGVVCRSVGELQQTLKLCELQHDAETAVRAYLRFVCTHTTGETNVLAPPNSTERQSKSFRASDWSAGVDAVALPLLSIDHYTLLLSLAGTHVTASEGTPKHWLASWKVTPASAVPVSKKKNAALSVSPPQPEPVCNAEEEDSDVERLYRLRAVIGSTDLNEFTGENAGKDAHATAIKSKSTVETDGTNTADTTVARPRTVASAVVPPSVQRRSLAFEASCASAYRAIAATLPYSLRYQVEDNMSLVPLITLLHNALRWCRLRPRRQLPSLQAGSVSTNVNNGIVDFGAAAMKTMVMDTEASDDSTMAGVDVLTCLLSSALHLAASEVRVAGIDAGESSSSGNDNSAVSLSNLQNEINGSTVTTPVGARCQLFTCRLPYEPASWKLLQYADVVLEYVLLYLHELQSLEDTTLWVSPAQRLYAEVAMGECLQVVLAVMEAVDVWAVEYKAQQIAEHAPSRTTFAVVEPVKEAFKTDDAVSSSRQDEGEGMGMVSDSAIDTFRLRLRNVPLKLLKRLLSDAELLKATALSDDGALNSHRNTLNALMCLIEGDVRAFEECSPAKPLVFRLCTSSADTSTGELLTACSQTHYASLTNLIDNLVFPNTGISTAVERQWSGKRLSYVLRCLTAGSVGWSAKESQPQQQKEVNSSVTQGLLARLAAADVTLRRLFSCLTNTLANIEAATVSRDACDSGGGRSDQRTEDDSLTSQMLPPSVMAQLMSVSSEFSQVALLLDETTAWWNTLHLETAVRRRGENKLADEQSMLPSLSSSRSANGINWSVTRRSLLSHIRAEITRLGRILMDLYASAWWGLVLSKLEARGFAKSAASFWSREDVRFQHLYVTCVLQHQSERRSHTVSKESEAWTVQSVEKLLQALIRYAPSSVMVAREKVARQPHSHTVDIEALLADDNTALSETDGEALRALAVERVLLTFLVDRGVQKRQKAAASTKVASGVFERVFQAAMSRLTWQTTFLLWRALPLLLEQNISLTTEDEFQTSTPQLGDTERSGGLSYTVPVSMWRLLRNFTLASIATNECHDPDDKRCCVKSSSASNGGFDVRSLLSVSLLSPSPLVVGGLLTHPLLRQQQQMSSNIVGAPAGASSQTWLKRLVVFGVDEEVRVGKTIDLSSADVFDNVSSAGRKQTQGHRLPSASYLAVTLGNATCAASTPHANKLRKVPNTPVAALLPTSLCQRVVPSLVLATLADPSLTSENALSLAAPATPSLPSADREAVLLDLVHFLGHVAPHAWQIALQWIVGTPYPTLSEASTQAGFMKFNNSPRNDAVKLAASQPSNTLSPVEMCTLRRLRAAFLACEAWPADVARPLLQYVLDRQKSAIANLASTRVTGNGNEGKSTRVVFPEAAELYTLFCPVAISEDGSGEKISNLASSTARHRRISPLEASLREELKLGRVRKSHASAEHCELVRGKQRDSVSVTYSTCAVADLLLSSPAELRKAIPRQARFHVFSSTLPLAPVRPLHVVSSLISSSVKATLPSADALDSTQKLSTVTHKGAFTALQVVAYASIDPAFSDVSPSLFAWLQQLARAASLHACARLFHTSEWGENVLRLRRRELGPVLQLVWKTLLMRKAEIDAASHKQGETQSRYRSTRNSRSWKDEHRSNYRGETKIPPAFPGSQQVSTEILKVSEQENAWLEVCASLYLVTARASRRFTAMTFHTRTKLQKMRLMADQVKSLKTEVCCFWVSSFLERALKEGLEKSLDRTTVLEAEGVKADFNDLLTKYLKVDSSPTCDYVATVQNHVQLAYWKRDGNPSTRTTEASTTATAARKSDGKESAARNIAVEQQEILAEIKLCLRNTAEALLSTERERSSGTTQWALWPPAAWQVWRLLQAKKGSSNLVLLRNPVLILALMRAWQRQHSSVSISCSPAPDEGGPVSVYANCFTALCTESYSTVKGEQGSTPGMKRTDVSDTHSRTVLASPTPSARFGNPAKWSLVELWRCVDTYVHKGYTPLPRSKSTERLALSEASSDAASSFPSINEESLPVGGVRISFLVMKGFLQLLSEEDTRLRQQGHPTQKQQQSQHELEFATANEVLSLKAVLRSLRPQLLPGYEATVSSHVDKLLDLFRTINPWRAYVPQHSGEASFTALATQSRKSSDGNRRRPAVPNVNPWHTLLHVLHLCTAGLLDRSAQQRGRCAAPSAAAMGCVAEKLTILRQLQEEMTTQRAVNGEERRKEKGNIGSDCREPMVLLSFEDGQRILCWQLRQLHIVQTHVNALHWTVEQQQQLEVAHQCVHSSVSHVISLTKAHRVCSTHDNNRVALQLVQSNAVEAATAACFYPDLSALLKAVMKRNESEEMQRSETEHADKEKEGVVTTFADRRSVVGQSYLRVPSLSAVAEVTTTSHICSRDDLSATALLAALRKIINDQFSQDTGNEREHSESSGAPSRAQLHRDFVALRRYLSAVLGNVAQRRHNHDPTLLLRFLDGTEVNDILDEMSCSTEGVQETLLRVLTHLLGLLETYSPSSPSICGSDAIAEAGLCLLVALQPWLPAHTNTCFPTATPTTYTHITAASLVFVLIALERKQPKDGDAFTFKLVSWVLNNLLRQRQAEALSSRGVALLGIIYQRLFEGHQTSASLLMAKQGGQELSAADAFVVPQVAVHREKLLWRLLHALSSLSEREAAEVQEIWRTYTVRCSFSSESSELTLRNLTAAAAVRSMAAGDNNGRRENPKSMNAKGTQARWGTSSSKRNVVEELYRNAIELLSGSSDGGGFNAAATKLNDDFYAAAVRLRTWWTADGEGALRTPEDNQTPPRASREVAQVQVLEDVLCQQLMRDARMKKENASSKKNCFDSDTTTLFRAARDLRLELYRKYVAVRNITSGSACNSRGVRSSDCLPSASLALQLSTAASLLPPASTRGPSHNGALPGFSETHITELIAAFADFQSTLRVTKVAEDDKKEVTRAQPSPLASVDINLKEDVKSLATYLLESISRRLRSTRSTKVVTDASLLHSQLGNWRAIVTPLRALLCAETLRGEAKNKQLISTCAGLQYRSSPTVCFHNTLHAKPQLPSSLLPTLYLTLRNLAYAHQLQSVPLRVLLREQLLPLLVLETRDAQSMVHVSCAQLANRASLLQQLAQDLAAHPALFENPHRSIKVGEACGSVTSPLARVIQVAANTVVTASDSLPFSTVEGIANSNNSPDVHPSGVFTELCGWPAALLILKVIALLEAAFQHCGTQRTSTTGDATSTFPQHPRITKAADAFVSRYAASLAQRGSALGDYLAFALVARRYTSVGDLSAGSFNKSASVLDWSQLHHVITAGAPPRSVGAISALFRQPVTPADTVVPLLLSSRRVPIEETDGVNYENGGLRAAASPIPNKGQMVLIVIAAVTEGETQELQKLSRLLAASLSAE